MAPVAMQGRGSASMSVGVVVVVLLLSMFMSATHAARTWIVGGEVSKWSYLHPTASPSFYSDWASNKTFETGDTLLFEYDNSTHTVLQLSTGLDFTSCNLKTSITKWSSGMDSVFISKAGTYYYACGAPSHCEQGMKFSITATGNYVAPPPTASNGTGPSSPNTSHASPRALHSGVVGMVFTILVVAATLRLIAV